MINVDGSYGEGGGQIIRTCLSLAAITGKEFRIENIRAGRSKQGLQPQHLAAVRAAATICAAELDGDEKGSGQLRLRPQAAVSPGRYRFDIGTAGATTLVFQTLFAPLSQTASPSNLTITGGTHVPHAPPVEFLLDAYLPALELAGCFGSITCDRAGYYPRGGGQLDGWIEGGAAPRPIDLVERGKLVSLTAHIVTSGLPDHVMERGEATVSQYMKGIGRRVDFVRQDRDSPGQGAAIVITARCEQGLAGFTAMGERGKPMEKVAQEACDQFMSWWKSGAACDERLADQLVLPASMVAGESRWTSPRATEHLRTALWTVKQFLPIEFTLEPGPGESTMVKVKGAGL